MEGVRRGPANAVRHHGEEKEEGTFFAHKKGMTEHTSSFVHSFSMVTILKLLPCLFTSPEVVTITAIWW
jgi:hypothetical protein